MMVMAGFDRMPELSSMTRNWIGHVGSSSYGTGTTMKTVSPLANSPFRLSLPESLQTSKSGRVRRLVRLDRQISLRRLRFGLHRCRCSMAA